MFVGFFFDFLNFFVLINFFVVVFIMMYLCCLSLRIGNLFFWYFLNEFSGFCIIVSVLRVIFLLYMFCSFGFINIFFEDVIIDLEVFMVYVIIFKV